MLFYSKRRNFGAIYSSYLTMCRTHLFFVKIKKSKYKSGKKQKNKTEVDYFNLAMIPIRDIFALPSLSAQNYSHVYIQHPNTHPYPHLTDCISSSSPWPPEAKCRRSRDKCCPRDNIRIEMECYKYP